MAMTHKEIKTGSRLVEGVYFFVVSESYTNETNSNVKFSLQYL